MFTDQQVEKLCSTSYLPANGGIADFCFCYDNDLWHFFYILYEYGIEHDCHHVDQNRKIGYSVSPDLLEWDVQESPITARAGKWDCGHVWAPAVVKQDDYWYMFYTGTNDGLFQKIGIVISKDLKNWEYPCEEAVIDASAYPWSKPCGVYIDEAYPEYFNCRDPYLIEHDGTWLCYYTARTGNEGNDEAVLALATSNDLVHWNDRGYVLTQPIFGSDGEGTYMVESPCVFRCGDTFYVVYNQGRGMKYVASQDPYSFRDCEPKTLMDHVFNFEVIDLESGLFAYAEHGDWMKLFFGTFEVAGGRELSVHHASPEAEH